ncbi:MAG TPA: bifunctional diguanylate cyclase/phosphodiesterase [Thermoanaerobaculia bacterium]|nr:bifunctional diguanylate cyclase/phosphodiesterase [Thermoanaerobaculia bacterium]
MTKPPETPDEFLQTATRLRLLVQQIPAILWTTGSDLRVTSIQGMGLAALDLESKDFVGRNLCEVLGEEDSGTCVQAHLRALAGESVSFELMLLERVFQSHVEPLRDAADQLVGCIGAAFDITERKQAEDGVRSLTETLEALVAASPLAIVTMDSESRVTLWSPAAERTFGWTAAEVIGKPLPFVPEDKWDEHLAMRRNVLDGQRFTGIETRRRDRAGSPLDLRISAAPLHDGKGRTQGIVSFLEDISDRKRAERAIRRLASMPEQSPDPVVELDLSGTSIYVNQAARSMFPELQALGSLHPVLSHVAAILPRFRHGERKSFSFEVAHEDSVYHQMVYFVPDISLVRVFLHDRTEQHRARLVLEREAMQDRLTELPNRAFLLRRLEEMLRLAKERTESFSVFCLNFDRFKVVNDSLGQGAGDALLVEIARRISACLGPDDTAARLPSDEFAILLRSAPSLTDSLHFAERLREAVSAPLEISRQEIFPSVSIGIVGGAGYDDPETLMRDAHVAMYRAKSLGGGRHEVFDRTMGNRSLERLSLENGLRRAIERGELKLLYQPIVRLEDGAIVGLEALARWARPGHGLLPPSEFIPIAEESGLILPFSYWAITELCKRMGELQPPADPARSFALHFNVSARLFADPSFAERVGRALAGSRGSETGLVLEMNESVLMDDPDSASEILTRMRNHGARLSVDDFGTSNSSLNHLQRFPIDSLKIDRSFVAKIGGRGEEPEILRAIFTLARRLGIQVIAEGVETEAQLALLREMGCTLAQGFLFSRPVEREAARDLLSNTPPWTHLLHPRSHSPRREPEAAGAPASQSFLSEELPRVP